MTEKEIKININIKDKSELIFFALIGIVGAIFIYYGAMTNAFGFGDESYYALAAKQTVENGMIIPRSIDGLYTSGGQPGDCLGKPPLSYYPMAIGYALGGLTGFKLVVPIFGILIIALVYYIAKSIYVKEVGSKIGVLAALITAGTPLLIHFSIISYAETISTFFILLAIFTSYMAIHINTNKKWLIFAGISLGLAFLSKEIAFFIPLGFIIYIVIKDLGKTLDMEKMKKLIIITIIGIAILSPWLIRNMIVLGNPVYPFFPEIFGYECLNEQSIYFRQSTPYKLSLIDIFNFNTLQGYLSVILFLWAWGVVYVYFKKSQWLMWLLISSFILALPVLLISLADIRYIFQLIPLLSLIIASFVNEVYLDKDKRVKLIGYGFLLVIIILSVLTIATEPSRIDSDVRHYPTGTLDAYKWIKKNTNENDVIMDIYAGNLLLNANRTAAFVHHTCCPELYQFWNGTEEQALQSLEKYDVDYIVVETALFVTESYRKHVSWTAIDQEFIFTVKDWSHFELVYDQNSVVIWKVNYESA